MRGCSLLACSLDHSQEDHSLGRWAFSFPVCMFLIRSGLERVPGSLVWFRAVNYYGCYRTLHNITEYKLIRSSAQKNVNRRDLKMDQVPFPWENVLIGHVQCFGGMICILTIHI